MSNFNRIRKTTSPTQKKTQHPHRLHANAQKDNLLNNQTPNTTYARNQAENIASSFKQYPNTIR
jgi:hypothetical protein